MSYLIIAHESLALSSLPPAAVTVLSIHPRRVAFLVLLCKGLQYKLKQDYYHSECYGLLALKDGGDYHAAVGLL